MFIEHDFMTPTFDVLTPNFGPKSDPKKCPKVDFFCPGDHRDGGYPPYDLLSIYKSTIHRDRNPIPRIEAKNPEDMQIPSASGGTLEIQR